MECESFDFDILSDISEIPFIRGQWRTDESNRAKTLFEQFVVGQHTEVKLNSLRHTKSADFKRIILPPSSITTLSLRTYCMDSGRPAPKSGEKMYLIPISKLIRSDFFPIYEAILVYSHMHPEHHQQIQRIVWNLTNACLGTKVKSLRLVSEDYELLDSAYPQGASIVQNYCGTRQLENRAANVVADELSKFLGKNNKNLKKMYSDSIHTFRSANKNVEKLLKHMESSNLAVPIPSDNSEYSLIELGVAVLNTHKGGARKTQISILNTTNRNVIFYPAYWVLQSNRDTQRLSPGGIEDEKRESIQNQKDELKQKYINNYRSDTLSWTQNQITKDLSCRGVNSGCCHVASAASLIAYWQSGNRDGDEKLSSEKKYIDSPYKYLILKSSGEYGNGNNIADVTELAKKLNGHIDSSTSEYNFLENTVYEQMLPGYLKEIKHENDWLIQKNDRPQKKHGVALIDRNIPFIWITQGYSYNKKEHAKNMATKIHLRHAVVVVGYEKVDNNISFIIYTNTKDKELWYCDLSNTANDAFIFIQPRLK